MHQRGFVLKGISFSAEDESCFTMGSRDSVRWKDTNASTDVLDETGFAGLIKNYVCIR